jgi:ABC-type transport system substrate-binding protein
VDRLSFTVVSNDLYQPTTAAIDRRSCRCRGVGVETERPDAAEYFGIVAGQRPGQRTRSTPDIEFWSSPVDLLIFFQAFPSTAFNGDLPDIAAAVEQWQTAPDVATLETAARAFQLTWAEQLPEIPILTRKDVWVAQKNVMGYAPFQSMLYPLYNDVYIAS